MEINDILQKSRDAEPFDKDELIEMLSLPPNSTESYLLMAEANRISKELTENKAEVHAQFSLNLAPCACNCSFCSFAKKNGIFDQETEISPEEAVSFAKQFERDGANAIFLMTTANYPFSKFIEVSHEIKKNLRDETKLIANIGDQSLENAKKLKQAGHAGVYHALRLREGIDTGLSPENRKKSIRNFQEAGLKVGTCVEPIGPEHTNGEIAELILFTGSFNPSFSGAARRIAIPGTEMASIGMISELRMVQIVAVTRIGIPKTVLGNCTHEPCTLGGIAGANLFWAEVGANPRDIKERTEEGRGETIESCRNIFRECGWDIWELSSRYYNNHA
jgi:biotin synthase